MKLTPLSLLPLTALAAQAQQRPNIVYIMSDDHTAQMLSAYGNSPILTPNMDRIAQEGVIIAVSWPTAFLVPVEHVC